MSLIPVPLEKFASPFKSTFVIPLKECDHKFPIDFFGNMERIVPKSPAAVGLNQSKLPQSTRSSSVITQR